MARERSLRLVEVRKNNFNRRIRTSIRTIVAVITSNIQQLVNSLKLSTRTLNTITGQKGPHLRIAAPSASSIAIQ